MTLLTSRLLLSGIILVVAYFALIRIWTKQIDVIAFFKSPGEIIPIKEDLANKGDERPRVWLKTVGLNNFEANRLPTVQFEFQNIGQRHALELTIETAIHASAQKLTDDPPAIEVETQPSKTILPKGETMTKTISFGRPVTANDIQRINSESLFVYAYGVIRYKAEGSNPETKPYTLKFCVLYNPKTTFFQHMPFFNYSD